MPTSTSFHDISPNSWWFPPAVFTQIAQHQKWTTWYWRKWKHLQLPLDVATCRLDQQGEGGGWHVWGTCFTSKLTRKREKYIEKFEANWATRTAPHTHTQAGRQANMDHRAGAVVELIRCIESYRSSDPSIVCISSETETMRATTLQQRQAGTQTHTHSHRD